MMGRAGRGSAHWGLLNGTGERETDLAHPGESVEERHVASGQLEPFAVERRAINVKKPQKD